MRCFIGIDLDSGGHKPSPYIGHCPENEGRLVGAAL